MKKEAGLEEKSKRFSTSPGVYLMKNSHGDVVYIGKAKNLRGRIRSYFAKKEDSRPLIRFLMRRVEDIESILTDTEKEALILENNLIKKYKPRYNVNLKDDKTYFSLKINCQDRFPKLTLVRKVKKDGARYFGPFSSSYAVKDTLKAVSRTFYMRTCRDSHFENRSRPCLSYQIKRCLAPCCGLIDEERYNKYVKEVILFLEGKSQELLRLLRKRMKDEADNLNFEEAARVRDQILSVEKTIERQKVVTHLGGDQDIFAFYRDGGLMEIQVMTIRKGRLLDTPSFLLTHLELQDTEAMSSFIKQYYSEERFVPKEILISLEIEDKNLVEEWFSEKKGGRVKIYVPKKGGKLELLKMAKENARNAFMDRQRTNAVDLKTLEDIQKRLLLKRLPRKIECFDISNISGKLAVGSVVTFEDGRKYSSGYRHFKIKTVVQADDYKMMYEVIKRRQNRLSDKNELPDLILVDGGKGQLNVTMRVLKEFNRENIDVASLAKGEGREKIFIPNRSNPIFLQRNSKGLLLLQKIRDEAHSFALTYHQKLRKKHNLRSELEGIPGVGAVRKKALLTRFGGLKNIQVAKLEELAQVPGMNGKVAINVFRFFHGPADP